MENKAHALAAGLFVLCVGALLVALAFWLTRDAGDRRGFELSTREAVTGLQPQAAVRFRGVGVGKVIAIGLDPQVAGNVLVQLEVDTQLAVTQSTFATLGYQGVTGLAFVQLDDAGESTVPLAGIGNTAPRIPLRAGLLATLSQRGSNILQQLEESTLRVNQLLQPDNQKVLITALGSLSQAAQGVAQLTGKAQQLLDGPTPTPLPALLSQANTTLTALQGTAQSVSSSADEVKSSAAEFRRMSEKMNQAGGTLDTLSETGNVLSATGRSFRTSTVPKLNRTAEDSSRAVRQAGQVFDQLGDNPQALIFGRAPPVPGPGEPGFAAPERAK